MATHDLPPETPSFIGTHGKAWTVDVAAVMAANHIGPHATVGQWLIYAPYAHPTWHSYALSLIHLRPVEGLVEPVLYIADATHELMLYALDPNYPVRTRNNHHILTPPNFCAQFVASNDADAAARLETSVQDIIDGTLNPDTDNMREWVRRYGASNLRRKEWFPESSDTVH